MDNKLNSQISYKHIIKYIKNAIDKNNLSHAYIFDGCDKYAREELAKEIEYLIFCDNNSKCMNCTSCIQVGSDTISDIIHIKNEEKSIISVKDIREKLCEDVYIKPFLHKYKLYIIHDAHLLNNEAQNAILKTLEEPPSYVVILMLCDNHEILNLTIQSRCNILSLRLVDRSSIVKELSKINHINKEKIADLSRGKIGLSILMAQDDNIFNKYEDIIDIIYNLKSFNIIKRKGVESKILSLIDEGVYFEDFCDILRVFFRDILYLMHNGDKHGLILRSYYDKLSDFLAGETFLSISKKLDAIYYAEHALACNVNSELVVNILVDSIA